MKKNGNFLPKPMGRAICGVVLSMVVLLSIDGWAVGIGPGRGFGGGAEVPAGGALAMFLLGLAIGVPAGIGCFFTYLIFRQKRESEHDHEMDELLEFLGEDDAGEAVNPWSEPNDAHGPIEQDPPAEDCGDPWERPVDWWRHAGDDA